MTVLGLGAIYLNSKNRSNINNTEQKSVTDTQQQQKSVTDTQQQKTFKKNIDLVITKNYIINDTTYTKINTQLRKEFYKEKWIRDRESEADMPSYSIATSVQTKIDMYREAVSLNSFGNNIYAEYVKPINVNNIKYLQVGEDRENNDDGDYINHNSCDFKINKSDYIPGYNLINQIIGPVSCYHITYKNLELYLFGDCHQRGFASCENYVNAVNITKVIELIIMANKWTTIDFFIEDFFYQDCDTKKYIPYDYSPDDFTKNIDTTLGIDLIRNKFKIHCPRRGGSGGSGGSGAVKGAGYDCSGVFKNLRLHNIDYCSLIFGRSNNFIKKIEKQLEKVDKMMRTNLNEYMEEITSQTYYQKTIDEKDVDIPYNDYVQRRMVDIYTLARIFRQFDNHETKNVIIYAGQYHIHEYVSFFDKIGAKVNVCGGGNFKITDKPSQCIGIKNSNIPYFNNTENNSDYRKKIKEAFEKNSMLEVINAYME